MCGIAGILNFGSHDSMPPLLVGAMADALAHRGPDDRGEYVDPTGRLAFGFTRLSIIDPAGGHQPMASGDGAVWIVFNGEIYNYRALRARLAGRRFRTQSDTEVILHLYEEMDLAAFSQLRGMFALALWDRRLQRLVLVRDRLGIKPLYYAGHGPRLAFASEIPALLRAGGSPRAIDSEGLRYFLEIRAIPAPLTLLRGVSKLAPGHYVVANEHGVGPQVPYWSLETTGTAAGASTPMEAVEQVRTAVNEAVAAHMVADVPVGALLSGGVDSSVIVAAMRRQTEGEIHTFNVGFEEVAFSEALHARRVSGLFRTVHHEHILTPEEFVAFLPQMVEEFADPVADPAAVPLYYLARLIRRQGIKVVLSGEGSDEVFAGYPSYLEHLGRGAAGPSLRGLVHGIRGGLARQRRGLAAGPRRRRLRRYPGHAGLSDPSLVDALLPGAVEGRDILDDHYRRALGAGLDRLQTMLAMDLWTRIPEDLLCRTDRMTMANSVEARVPFLDHGLVELGFWLPSRLKIEGRTTKAVLKRAAEAWLPRDLVHRPKMGFPTPIRRWLSSTLRGMFRHWLLEVREEPRLFDYRVLERLAAHHFAGREDLSLLLWRIWFFKLWYARWIRGEALELGTTAAALR
jgi:asparagine synthase (glutamine-hydrolysing)